MISSDETALYREIVRNPDDDTARLVYADWLQENGRGEEAEFIRTQCRLAAADPSDPEYPALVDRDEELCLWLTTHAPGPQPTFPGGLSVAGGPLWWQSHRGFPRFLEFDGSERHGVKAMRALASGLARAFDALPTRWLVVRYITLAQLVALLKQPVLAGLSHLTVQMYEGFGEVNTPDGESDAVAAALAGCKHLRNLRGLSLAVGFGDAGCASLVKAPWGALEWFSLTTGFSVDELRTLAGAAWFRQLRALKFEALHQYVFDELVELPAFPRLHALDLSQYSTRYDSWEMFARSRTFPALTRLDVSDCDLSGRRFEALVSATGFQLSVLNAQRCGAGHQGETLTHSPWAPTLRVLNLAHNSLAPTDVKAIAACKRFTGLQHLDLSYNSPGASGLLALANPALRGLGALRLGGGEFNNGGLTPAHFDKFLTKLNMPDLRHLDLSGCPVGATAAKKLASPKFASLTRLALKGCKLSDTAVATLLAAPALRNLIQLDLSDNGLKTGPKALGDPSVLPNLASCSLAGNPLAAPVARKLRQRPGVTGLPKAKRKK